MANQYEDIPEVPSDMIYNWSASTHTLQFDGESLEWEDAQCDVVINEFTDSIMIITGVKWYTRIWYILTNPILYIFTGKIRY
jgi:hypothetical protein